VGRVEVILLDTHVWIWWVQGDPALPASLQASIELRRYDGIAISAISCWEVAKFVERNRLDLPRDIHEWMELALGPSTVTLLPLTEEIAIASTTLPAPFHRDPADEIIVATSRVHDLPLATCDQRIRSYPHVRLLEESQIHDR